MEETIIINQSDVTFNSDGTITVKNELIRNKLETLNSEADLLRVLRKDNTEASNFGYCSSNNIVCNESIFDKNDLTFPSNDEVIIKNSTFVTNLISEKLKGIEQGEINIGIKGYKSM